MIIECVNILNSEIEYYLDTVILLYNKYTSKYTRYIDL